MYRYWRLGDNQFLPIPDAELKKFHKQLVLDRKAVKKLIRAANKA
jgi:hypothetical protein